MEKTMKKYFPLFVLPTLVAFLIAFVVPFVMGVYLSFCEFTTVTNARFVGTANYIKAFSNQGFLRALIFTVLFAAVAIVTINVFGFLLALMLTQKLPVRNLFRTVFFMPNLIGGIVLGYIWQSMINGVLSGFGMTMLMDAKYGYWGLIILMNWQMIGYIMVIYIAGLQNVSTDVLEAAKIDGANKLQTLFRVTIPMMMPARITPRQTDRVVLLKPMFRKDAARVPVQAPVPGRGMPTNSISAANSPPRPVLATSLRPPFSPFTMQ